VVGAQLDGLLDHRDRVWGVQVDAQDEPAAVQRSSDPFCRAECRHDRVGAPGDDGADGGERLDEPSDRTHVPGVVHCDDECAPVRGEDAPHPECL
jgi:hypothetical protein